MAQTATKERHQTAETPQQAPEAKSLTLYQQFEHELEERSDIIASMLPTTVTPARFKNTVVAAIRQDPAILSASIRSVMSAVIRAAQDGLVPDGREGHIAIYNTNVAKRGEPDRWEKRAQWNPMAYGLRKRLRELDGIIANSEVVHLNDHFLWEQGDAPRIEHKPATLGTDRGKMIGAYCIYKREDGTILHREVMDREAIEKTREQSKAKDSLMWTKFVSEGYRKAVLRRGIKTVPVSDQMREIIRRDDEEHFSFDRTAPVALVPPPAPALAPPSPPKAATPEPVIPEPEASALSEADERALDRQTMREMEGEAPALNMAEVDELTDWLADRIREAPRLKTMAALDEMDDMVCREIDGRDELRTLWNDAYSKASVALTGKKR